jgi:hypothetical protein
MHLPRNRCRRLRWLTLLIAVCLHPSGAAADDPAWARPFEARYAVRTSGMPVGTMTRRLVRAPGAVYRFESVVESGGLAALLKPLRIEETSEGTWESDGPRPTRYAYSRRSGRKSKQVVIEFDWQHARTSGRIGASRAEGPLPAGTVDKLGYQLILMRDHGAGRNDLAYRVADVGEIKEYRLTRRAAARIEAGGRAYSTLPVEYARDDGRRTVLWCAEALGYLPVRIEYTEKDGKVTTATLLPSN